MVREDKPNDIRIVAYLRLKDPAISDEKLRAHVRQKLPDYMMPAHFVPLQRFPLTPNAKVDPHDSRGRKTPCVERLSHSRRLLGMLHNKSPRPSNACSGSTMWT